MKTQSTIATLVLLGIMMLVRLQGISAEPAGMDKMAVRLQEAYSASASDGTVQNLKPGEGFRLTYSFNANDGVVIPLCRDAIVFVADARHPSAGLLRNNGLSFDGIKQLIMSKSDALSIADELIYEKLIHFLNIQPLQAPPFSSFSKEMRVGSVHAMLFSEMGAELFAEGNNLMIVPLDRNGNGQLEDNESFYASFETFSRAVWLGKYPKAFTLTLNAVVPADGIADNQFVQWLLSDGQQMIASNGFIPLNAHELMANRNRLQTTALTQLEDASASTIPLWVIIVIVFAALAIVFYLIISALTRPHSPVGETSAKPSAFGSNSFGLASGRLYDKTHTWVFREENGTVKIGLDDFINKVFGDAVGIELLKPGDRFIKGEIMATITHLGKKVSVKAPVSGRILAVNPSKSDRTMDASADWIYRIEPDNWTREQGFLSMAEQHGDWLKSEFLRFREFIADAMRSYSQKETQVIMLDGGEIIEGVMLHVEPQAWEDFQKSFMQVNV